MTRLAAAVSVLAIGTAAAWISPLGDTPPVSGFSLQAEGDFCTGAPDSVDSRIATAVGAASITPPPTTPPIAILDTGVGPDVPELDGRLVNPFDSTNAAQKGDDVDGHGTEVAAIAAGAPGRFQGVSPTSPVMPVKAYNLSGETTAQWLVGGISWAIQQHAGVINISSSSVASDAKQADIDALTRATTDAFNAGIMVIASAGNDGGSVAHIPASLPHVFVVGASNLQGTRATFSSIGPWVDVVSPAVSMIAPVPAAYCPSGFAVANGSSFAAPAAAGAAALLAQLRPELSMQQRFDVLRTSAHDQAPAGRDDETGFGLLDVSAAINAPVPTTSETSPEVDDDPYYVRGPFSANHPILLTRTKKVRVAGQLSSVKDPSDVYRVQLKKGERFVASAKVSGAESLISLGLWKPAVGDFDVSNEITKQQIVSSGGFSSTPELKMRATKGGTYYVSVEAPDVDTDDPTAITPTSMPYQVLLSKSAAPKKKPVKKKPKSKKKK